MTIIKAILLSLCLLSLYSIAHPVCGAEGGSGEKVKVGPGPIAFILNHAKELDLKKDQKEQLAALAKETKNGNTAVGKPSEREARLKELNDGIASILSGDQATKLKELRDAAAGVKGRGETPSK